MIELLENKEYQDLTIKHSKELLRFMQNNHDNFNITANILGIKFQPELPESIFQKFGQFVLFTLSNYTLSSLKIEDNFITFEAGFGAENFGATCKIAIESIFQISVENSILFLNPNATMEKDFFGTRTEEEQKIRSMNAFSFKK